MSGIVVPNAGLLVPSHVAEAVDAQRRDGDGSGAAGFEAPARYHRSRAVGASVCDEMDTFDLPDRDEPEAIFIPRKQAVQIPDCLWDKVPVPLWRMLLILERRIPETIGQSGLVLSPEAHQLRQEKVTQGLVIAVNKWCWAARGFLVINEHGEEVSPGPQAKPGDWVSYDPLCGDAKFLFHPRTRECLRFRLLTDNNVRCRVSPDTDPLW